MTLSPEACAQIEAQMRIIAEDYPTCNLVLLREPDGIPEWGLTVSTAPSLADDCLESSLPTIGIALSGVLYDTVEPSDLEWLGARFGEICHRPADLSPEHLAAFRASAKVALGGSLSERWGSVWMRSAGVPLGSGAEPLPFSVRRDPETGDFWIAVPPRWLIAAGGLGFDLAAYMDGVAAEILEERSIAQGALN